MNSKSSLTRLHFCNFKLNTLLEITKAINENLPTEELLLRFETLLINELSIGKLVIFANYSGWKIMLKAGEVNNEHLKIDINKDLLIHSEITTTSSTENSSFAGYDFIIPVFHNLKPIAYVLIGDVEEEKEGVSPTIKHLSFIQTLTNFIFVAIENKQLFEKNLEQERLKKEMELASDMQKMLIPDSKNFPENNFIELETFYLPHLEVGGDYYDFENLNDDDFFFCIADVSGKGISAALLMSNFQASLKAYLHTGTELPKLVSKLNKRVIEITQGEKFITIFAGKYNYKTRVLRYINAGHNPPILYDKKKKTTIFLDKGCTGIGMLDEVPAITEGVVHIKNNSKIVCFTDGLAELENENYDNNDAGVIAIQKCVSNILSIKNNFESLKKELNLFKTNPSLFDDITILGMEFF